MNNVIFQLVAIPFAAFFCFVTPVTASDPWDADPLSNPGTRDGSHFVSVSLLSDNEDGKSLFQGSRVLRKVALQKDPFQMSKPPS
jgi:hypothetical protein